MSKKPSRLARREQGETSQPPGGRRSGEGPGRGDSLSAAPRTAARYAMLLPGAAVLLAGLYLFGQMRPPSDGLPMRIHEFGKLPVVYAGRPQPVDTLARNSLMVISGRQTFRDAAGHEQPAVKWLLDVVSRSAEATQHKVFRIPSEQVLNLLGLQARKGFRYAIDEFEAKIPEIEKQATAAQRREPAARDVFDTQLLELAQHLDLYVKLSQFEIPHVVPPQSGKEEWKTFRQGVQESQLPGKADPTVRSWAAMYVAYEKNDADTFNQELAAYSGRVHTLLPAETGKANFEVFFNRFAPFYQCSVLYVVVFLLGSLGWLGWQAALSRTALYLLGFTLAVHTFALLSRMYIQGRPPVTNLYSSAVFIGWGCVVLAMVLEWIYRNGIGTAMAAVTGFLTLVIAHNLARDGDTLEMMQAVLDTNFWLATHVTAVTTGYAATFMAGFLGILFVLRGVFTRSLDRPAVQTLGRMIYGVVCFATFFSFTGTVLGGIWADQSWGRFWGWDPKENGALIIVLWNALMLHARWGGMVQQRGLAVLAIFGNIVTAWSYFGVNMLGVGLHSYGFMSSVAFWLMAFIASQLAFIGLGLLPLTLWRSFAAASHIRPKLEPRAVPALATTK